MNKNKKSPGKIIFLCVSLLLIGCGMNETQASSDISELKKLVQVSIPMKSVQWEVLKWPYDDGFLASPTELITLVAEFEPSDPKWFAAPKEPIKAYPLSPESGRTWMSPQFKAMLAAEYLDAKKYSCASYKAKFTKSGNPVEGFVCGSGGHGLLYLRLADYSAKIEPSPNISPATPELSKKK